jgi:hypothetical protein
MSDLPDRLRAALAGRYALDSEAGAGGMAIVYRAQDVRHHRTVALKVVRPELAGALGTDRFLREIELAAGLQHPHILPVFDSGAVDEGTAAAVPWFVMPFVDGESLRQRLQREGRLTVEDAAGLAAEVADALAYAHAHGVVHRDIKPENILLSGGHAVVADFGVAKAIERGAAVTPAAAPAPQLTRVGFAVGTPQYMSPEQATGADAVDARSDQYSLACVLYEMLTGAPPFTGPTPQSVIAQSMTAPRPRVGKLRAEVPPEVERAVARAMAADPTERFPDMAAFAGALREGRPRARVGRRALLVGALVVAGLAALLGLWLGTRVGERKVAREAHGMLVATDGWASLIAGDTTAGIGRLRQGITELSGPSASATSAFLRFQFALALSARPTTREEGIRWLRYASDDQSQTYLFPLSYLALGQALEAAGEGAAAADAYGRFIRLWDKADPPLQGRVREARDALARLTAEPKS